MTGRLTKRMIRTAIFLVAVAVSWPARAEELREIQAKSLRLGDVTGVAYYTVQGQGYRLVVTLAGQDSTPVRFESTLLPGQKVAVSVPGSPRTDARTIEFSRQEDRLVVASRADQQAQVPRTTPHETPSAGSSEYSFGP